MISLRFLYVRGLNLFFFFFEVYIIVHLFVYLFPETNRISQHLCVLFFFKSEVQNSRIMM